jgi:hypothetical protein
LSDLLGQDNVEQEDDSEDQRDSEDSNSAPPAKQSSGVMPEKSVEEEDPDAVDDWWDDDDDPDGEQPFGKSIAADRTAVYSKDATDGLWLLLGVIEADDDSGDLDLPSKALAMALAAEGNFSDADLFRAAEFLTLVRRYMDGSEPDDRDEFEMYPDQALFEVAASAEHNGPERRGALAAMLDRAIKREWATAALGAMLIAQIVPGGWAELGKRRSELMWLFGAPAVGSFSWRRLQWPVWHRYLRWPDLLRWRGDDTPFL